MKAQHAITKFRKDIIHLQEDGFEKPDQKKEDEDASKSRLPDETPQELGGIDRALPDGLSDASPEAGSRRNHPPLLRFLGLPASKKVNHGKNQDLDRKTDEEELLVRGWLESKKVDSQIRLPDVVKNPSGRDVTDIHDHVDDRERDRALPSGRIDPRCCQKHWCPERLAHRERKHAASQRQRWNSSHNHDAAGEGADRDPEEKSPAQTDRIGERASDQREHRHGRRPDPPDQRPGGLIAEAEVPREPQHHRFVRNRVCGVDEELDQERQPQFALRPL